MAGAHNNEKHNVRAESKDSNSTFAKKKKIKLQANQNQSVAVY